MTTFPTSHMILNTSNRHKHYICNHISTPCTIKIKVFTLHNYITFSCHLPVIYLTYTLYDHVEIHVCIFSHQHIKNPMPKPAGGFKTEGTNQTVPTSNLSIMPFHLFIIIKSVFTYRYYGL